MPKESLITWMLSAVVSLFFLIIVRIVHAKTRRERLAELMSSIWAITCPEQNCAAIVELVNIGPKMVVQDCSVQSSCLLPKLRCRCQARRADPLSSNRPGLRVGDSVPHQ